MPFRVQLQEVADVLTLSAPQGLGHLWKGKLSYFIGVIFHKLDPCIMCPGNSLSASVALQACSDKCEQVTVTTIYQKEVMCI